MSSPALRDDPWLYGAYARAALLAFEHRGRDALRILQALEPHLKGAEPSLLFEVRVQRLRGRLLIWANDSRLGRSEILDAFERLGGPALSVDLRSRPIARLVQELLNDLSDVGCHDEAISGQRKLREATADEWRRAARGVSLAGYLIDRGFSRYCADDVESAVADYEEAEEYLHSALGLRAQLEAADQIRWGAAIRNTLSFLVRVETRLAALRGDDQAFPGILERAHELLRATLDSGEATATVVGQRVGRVGAVHLRAGELEADEAVGKERIRQRAVPLLAWSWSSMSDGYVFPTFALDYVDALRLAGERDDARAVCRAAIERLEGQCGVEYPVIRRLRHIEADL